MNTGKGDTKSSLFVDNWLSDKKIQRNHLKTTQPEGEFTKISGYRVNNKHTVFLYTSNNESEMKREKIFVSTAMTTLKYLMYTTPYLNTFIYVCMYVCIK